MRKAPLPRPPLDFGGSHRGGYRMTEPRANAHCRMAAIRPREDHFDGTTERGKSPSTISAALNGHRASQKRPRSSPLGPLTSTASGGEL